MVIISCALPGARSAINTEPPDARRKVSVAVIAFPFSTAVACHSPANCFSRSNSLSALLFAAGCCAPATIASANSVKTTGILFILVSSRFLRINVFALQRPCSGKRHDRAHFDRAEPRARNFRGYRRGRLAVRRLHQIITAQLLLGFGKRTVCSQRLSVAHAHGGRGMGRLQRIPALDRGGMLFAERHILFHFSRVVSGGVALFIFVNQKKKLHFGSFALLQHCSNSLQRSHAGLCGYFTRV